MEILNSPWLIKMLEKSSKTPHGRLLNLFEILEDWLDAPNVAAQVSSELGNRLQTQLPKKQLQDFLALEAAKAGAAMPEMLASQLYFMAVAATQERLQANNTQSSSDASLGHAASFKHAKVAASALISAQTKTEFHIAKPTAYAMAASFAAVCAIAGSLLIFNLQQPTINIANAQIPAQAAIPQIVAAEVMADPQQTAALMAQIEQMRHGNCQLIEAIQLPDSQKGIYLNMVVNGQVSTNPQEQAIAIDLLSKTRCNYTPMLMANSTG
jgi:hypothetical protein